jgi:ParB/RepB/Spo0J family partition protein
LQELADSIKANGLAQPITVRWVEDRQKYEIVAGERRFRAHKLLGVATVRAIVRDLTDSEASAIMLAENTGRKDLDPVDEARAYKARMTAYGWDDKTVAEKAGVSVQRVRNRLALLQLRDDLLHLVRTGNLQMGYAQIIAEANLDKNRQLIALKRLQTCPAPTPQWFRKECGELVNQQAQGDLFDSVLFAGVVFDAKQTKQEFVQTLPADPRKDKAPTDGKTYKKVVENQIQVWFKAADQWDRFGKSAPRDRCLAAARALQAIVSWMPAHGGTHKRVDYKGQTLHVYSEVQ